MVFNLIGRECFDLYWVDFYNNFFKNNNLNIKIQVQFREWDLEEVKKEKRHIVNNDKFIISTDDCSYINVYFKTKPGGVLYNIINYLLKIFIVYTQPNSLLLHGSGLDIDGKAFLLLGPTGSGKSTFVSFFDPINVLNDDQLLISKKRGRFYAKGLNFWGRIKVNSEEFRKVSSIFFIFHGRTNKIIKMDKSMALKCFLMNSLIPFWDKEKVGESLTLIENLLQKIPIYYLYFRPTMEAKTFFLNFVLK